MSNQASNFAPFQNHLAPNPTTNKATNNMEENTRELGHLNKNSYEKWKPYSKDNRRILFKGINYFFKKII